MEKNKIRSLGITLILLLWVLAFVTFFYTWHKLNETSRVVTYFDTIVKSQPELPEHPPKWEDIPKDGNYTKNYTVLKPNHEQIFDGHIVRLKPTHVKINSDGFRDRGFSLEKSPNTFRVIMLGDSLVFGQGVELEESLPKQLEHILNLRYSGYKYEVLNFGASSHNTFSEVEMLKDKGLKYNPDLIIIGYLYNDLEDELFKRGLYSQIKQEYINKGLDLNDYGIEIHFKVLKTIEDKLKNTPFDESWKIVEDPLKELAFIAEQKNINVLIYSFECAEKAIDNTALKKFVDEHERFYFAYCNMTSDEKLFLHPLDMHPTPLAYKLHAEKIYETLIKQGLILPD